MILAASNIAWRPEERLWAYADMAKLGLTGLEIAPRMFFHESDDAFNPSPTQLRQAINEVYAEGLRLVSMQSLLFGVDGAELFGDAGARNRFRAGMERAIDLAGRCGIPNLVFGSPVQRRIPGGMAPERAAAEAAETFRLLGDRAATVGTSIAMEANPAAYGTNFLNTLAEVAAFVRQVSHPAIRIILDLGAQSMNGEAAATAAHVPALAGLLSHVHVSEAHLGPAPANPRALAPVLAALTSARYGGAVSIEMKRPDGGLVEARQRFAALAQAMELRGKV
jgi:sugar phosphate isomerase/epimerase